MYMKNLPDPDFVSKINKMVKKHDIQYDKENRVDEVIYDLAFTLSKLEPK